MSSQYTPTTLQDYRDKAAEIRAAAETVGEPAKSVMLRLAVSYDTLAAKTAYIDLYPTTRSHAAD